MPGLSGRGAVASSVPYLSLAADKLTATVMRLRERVKERFPERGLAEIGEKLVDLAVKARDATDNLTRPMLALRLASALLILLIVVGLGLTLYSLGRPAQVMTFTDFVQTLEAGLNDLVLIGVAVFFLLSIERRLKRRKALAAITELQSIAHIIDMHQLTKDPQHVTGGIIDTPSSPRRTLDRLDLSRYFDYCSEMLSLTGKIATLYVQKFDDRAVSAAVSEVESLTTGLSRKIWQKLMILESSSASPSNLRTDAPGKTMTAVEDSSD